MTKEQWMHMYQIVGAAQEVYNVLGRGMEEPIYQEAMEKELDIRGLKYQWEVVLHTWYKGIQLNKVYQADFVCEDVVVEFKSVNRITADHRAQLFNYLRITKQDRGILVNYGEANFHSERYAYDEQTDRYELITKDNLHKFVK